MIMDVVDMLPHGFRQRALASAQAPELLCTFSLSFDSIRPSPLIAGTGTGAGTETGSGTGALALQTAATAEGKDDVPLNTPAATSGEAVTFFASEAVISDPVPITGECFVQIPLGQYQ